MEMSEHIQATLNASFFAEKGGTTIRPGQMLEIDHLSRKRNIAQQLGEETANK